MLLAEKLKELFKGAKKEELTSEELSKIEDISKELNKALPVEKPAPPADGTNNSEVIQLVKTLSDEMKSLKESYAEQLSKTKAAEDELRNKANAELTAKKTALLNDALQKGKIASQDEDAKKLFQKLMDADLESAKIFIEKMPANPAAAATDKKPEDGAGKSAITAPAGTLNRAEVVRAAEDAFITNTNKGV